MNDRFNKFQSLLAQQLPGFTVKFKNESLLMKIIGKLMFFNPKFMTSFITTIGKTVYFPNQEVLDHGGNNSLMVLAHEFRHSTDADKMGRIVFSLLYLLPQLLAPFMLLLLPFCWPLALALFVLFLCPLPAPWRKSFELRGYLMSLFMANELLKEANLNQDIRTKALFNLVELTNTYFTSFDYYKMWPFGVVEQLNLAVPRIASGEILNDDVIYKEIAVAFANSKL